jgi:propionyl-CoA carboxylase alpha chain
MRVVRSLADLAGEVAAAEAEAASAFGDGTVFVEPYVEGARHVEVQVWGDAEGRVSVLGDRDCSVQRRHQKVVEEAPAPGIPDDVRAAMHDAARVAAEAIDYVGAGTVELLYDEQRQRFFFLEMNTRLQVEHPVTEAVTGLDLVALQVRAAEGGAGPVDVGEPHGHAIEVRLYAEDPANDYQPQSGRLQALEVPRWPGLRVDAGFEAGNEVSPHYDAMLAKVVMHADTRQDAARRLAGALAAARLHGVRTNRDLLVAVLRDDAFLDARLGTDLLDHVEPRTGPPADALEQSAFAAAVFLAEQARSSRAVQRGIPAGWRNVRSAPQRTEFAEVTVEWERTRTHHVSGPYVAALSGGGVALTTSTPDKPALTRTFDVSVYDERVDVESSWGHVTLTRRPRFTDPADQVASGSLLAPMPGSVVTVAVEAGQHVDAGQPVLVLEAMKMQHTVTAPHAGVVTDVAVASGDQVAAGSVLAVVEEQADD